MGRLIPTPTATQHAVVADDISTMSADQFVRKLDELRSTHELGSILLAEQPPKGYFLPIGYNGSNCTPQLTHINTGLFVPDKNGGWSERDVFARGTLALVLDDIGTKSVRPPMDPTLIIETSPGNCQWVYFYSDFVPLEMGAGMATAAAAAGIGDPFIENRSHHWWRLPGSLPEKKKFERLAKAENEGTLPDLTPARLIWASWQFFTYEEVAAGLGLDPQPVEVNAFSGSTQYDQETGSADPVLQWIKATQKVGRPDRRGFHKVLCPNSAQHTNQREKTGSYVPPNAVSRSAFKCQHAHCADIKLTNFRQFVAASGGPSEDVARAYARRVEPVRVLDCLPAAADAPLPPAIKEAVAAAQTQPATGGEGLPGVHYTAAEGLPGVPPLTGVIMPPAEPVTAQTHVIPDVGPMFQQAEALPLDNRAVVFMNDMQPIMQMLVDHSFTVDGKRTLLSWQGDFYRWLGTHWEVQEPEWIQDIINHFLSKFVCTQQSRGSGENREVFPVAIAASASALTNLTTTLRAITARPRSRETGWLDGREGVWQSVGNGVLDMNTNKLCPHDPDFFNTSYVDAPWDPNATLDGTTAGQFFTDAMGSDDQIALLQETFGYILSGDTRMQKAFMIVGRKRSGKGTIIRLLKALMPGQTASTRSNMLADKFVMENTIGKSLLVVPDVRLDKNSDFTAIGELILNVTGEDDVDIRRMQKRSWQGKTTVRLMLMSNSVPQLRDADGVLASRFMYLVCPNSFYDREDHELDDKLAAEKAFVLKWAVDGWRRLCETRRFTEPAEHLEISSDAELRMDPIGVFFKQKVILTGDTNDFVRSSNLKMRFDEFCIDNDIGPFTDNGFFKTLKTKLQPIRTGKSGDGKIRGYRGLQLVDPVRCPVSGAIIL